MSLRYFVLAAGLAIILTGCASGPAMHTDSSAAPGFEALRTSDRTIQRERFGDLAETAGGTFLGNTPTGKLIARKFEWVIPGVVLEEHEQSPFLARKRYQYNAATRKLDAFYIRHDAPDTYKHLIDLAVLPDGSVEWPLRMMGLEKPSYVIFKPKGELIRDFRGVQENEVTRLVSAEKYDIALEQEGRRLRQERRNATKRSTAFLNGAAQAIGGATEAARQTYEQQQTERQYYKGSADENNVAPARPVMAIEPSAKRPDESTSPAHSTSQRTGSIAIESVPKQSTAPFAPSETKPKAASNAPEPVLEGFVGRTCADARRYAENFPAVVVRVEPNEYGCIALARRLPPKGTASKQ